MVIDMKRIVRGTAAALFAVSLFVVSGCSDSSPVAPKQNTEEPPPPVVIKTPTKMRIDYLMMEWTALEKPNGDNWDLDLINAENRRPDIYAKLGNYETSVINNYDATGARLQRLNFSAPTYGRMNYDGSYTLSLYDKDTVIQGADDLIGSFTFRPDAVYRQDNAETFLMHIFVDGKLSAWAEGVWIY